MTRVTMVPDQRGIWMNDQSPTHEIVSDPERCAGCLMCQMRCSYRFTQAFNPSKSRIEILRQPGKGKREFRIDFREDCDQCGLCAKHCTYGALSRREFQ